MNNPEYLICSCGCKDFLVSLSDTVCKLKLECSYCGYKFNVYFSDKSITISSSFIQGDNNE